MSITDVGIELFVLNFWFLFNVKADASLIVFIVYNLHLIRQ